MKKSTLAKVIAVATATLTLAVIGSASGAYGSSGSKNTVKYLIQQPDTPEQLTTIKADIANFEKKSGVTVKLTVLPLDKLRLIIQTQLRSGTGPDVFQYDTGPGFAGVLAKAGLLYDLTEQYKKMKYPIYSWAKNAVTFNGKISGISDQIEELGLFYNKDILKANGIAVPQSLTDLKAAVTTLKAKGLIPMALGDKEGWEGGHLLSMSLTSRVGAVQEKSLIAGKSDWSGADVVAAINTWKDLGIEGSFPPSPTAINYDNANALFFSGKAAIYSTGTWLVQSITSNSKADIGFMPFPGPDGPGIATTGLGSGTFMSAKTKNPTAALKFMDYLTSADHGKSETLEHLIPTFPVSTKGLSTSPLYAQIVRDLSKYSSGSAAVGQSIDVVVTDVFNKAMWDGMQGVLSGDLSPEQVAKNLQTASTTSTK